MNLTELGAFLRSRRDRTCPSDVGLTAGPRRRVPGLRRDEVAQLAGVSVDYYIELERGRGSQPSEQMLAAIARALRLDTDERDHLYHLSGRSVPPPYGTAAHVQPAMLDLLGRLPTTPAQIITDLHQTLAQNRLAMALLGPPPAASGLQASFLYRWFTDPVARAIYPEADHARHSRVFVADLRAAVARRGHDAQATGMVTNLRRHSAEFTELWDMQEVAVRRDDRKRIVHSSLGVVELNCMKLFSEDGLQRLLWFTAPPGSPAVGQLELLSVVGMQELRPGRDVPTLT